MVRAKEGRFGGFAISVPQNLIAGVIFSFHNKLNHPKKTQLMKFISRYFYAPALMDTVEKVSSSCIQCMATKKLPKALSEDTTTIPQSFGSKFAADVLERNNQNIFICKEILSQFVSAVIIQDQTAKSLKEAIVQTVSPLANISGAEIKLDCAPGFQSLSKAQRSDPILQNLGDRKSVV